MPSSSSPEPSTPRKGSRQPQPHLTPSPSKQRGGPPGSSASAVHVPVGTNEPRSAGADPPASPAIIKKKVATRDPSGLVVKEPYASVGPNQNKKKTQTRPRQMTATNPSGAASVSSTKATMRPKQQQSSAATVSSSNAALGIKSSSVPKSGSSATGAAVVRRPVNHATTSSAAPSVFSSQATPKPEVPQSSAVSAASNPSFGTCSTRPQRSVSNSQVAPKPRAHNFSAVSAVSSVVSPVSASTTAHFSLKARADARISSEYHRQSFLRKRRELDSSRNQGGPGKIEIEEAEARQRAACNNNPLLLFFFNFAAALKVFVVYLVTIDTLVCNAVTVGMTIYWWEAKENNNAWHGAMSFVLVSFAVASPLTIAIRMAFDRREKALLCIANVRSFALHIYLAHALWDWKGAEGRQIASDSMQFDFEEHCDQVLEHLIAIGDEMTRFLTLPPFTQPRHRVLRIGRAEAAKSLRVAYHLLDSTLLQRITRLTVLAERLKAVGLSGSEISRVRQYERHLSNQLEQLRMYKVYRTPQALWAFARIFTLLLPPFYAPTFTEVGRELGHLWLGIGFAMITATCLTSLFESIQILEDPFTAFVTLDGIDVSEELEVLQWTQLINARKLLFPQSPPYPMQTRPVINMMGSHSYDPTVHYHSTPEMRELLMQTNLEAGGGGAGAYDNMANANVEGGTTNRNRKAEAARRRSHFAQTV